MEGRAGSSASAGTDMSAGRELTIQRTFAAPRSIVFRAWTERELLAQWSCPRGFVISENHGELRVGGAFFVRMHSAQGSEHRVRGVYREIVRPERLVFTHCWLDADGTPGPETVVTVTLRERGGQTEMTFHQGSFDSRASRDGHAEGWTSCFEQLSELLTLLPRDAAA